jgi:YVTN family beta-propeller protein
MDSRQGSIVRRLAALALVVSGMGLIGCGARPQSVGSAAGTQAVSRDDALLYVLDPESDTLAVVDARTEQRLATVAVGRAPERVVVGPDDTLYVSNRGSRSVSVIHRGAWVEAQRIPVGVEPVGMAVSPDNAALYVVNSTSLERADSGTLMAIDLRTLAVKWEVPVGEEPRGVALVGNHAVVTPYKRGQSVTVDVSSGTVVQP